MSDTDDRRTVCPRPLLLLLSSPWQIILVLSCWGMALTFARGVATKDHPTTHRQQQQRQQHPQEVIAERAKNMWGIQTGPANGKSDAGGMVYDFENDQLLLVGTTHDTQYFTPIMDGTDGSNANVDCFILTVRLPPMVGELSEHQVQQGSGGELAASAAKERQNFTFSGQKRILSNSLDRCDLVVRVAGEGGGGHHDHVFVGGTVATATHAGSTNLVTAVEPLVLDATVDFFQDSQGLAKIETGMPMQLFGNTNSATEENNPNSPSTQKTDIIIPAAMASYDHHLYMAAIKRKLVVTEASSAAEPKMHLSLVISRFEAMDAANEPLVLSWTREYDTGILEERGDTGEVPPVTSGMFHEGTGLNYEDVEKEVEELENEEEQYEEEEGVSGADRYRHEYRFDGVLISSIEILETPDVNEPYMLVAGSAPGTQGSALNVSHHPLMDASRTFVGDWDGFVTKVNARTGEVLRPPDYDSDQYYEGYNTWSYRVESQTRRNDFVQSICIPQLPHGMVSTTSYSPSLVFVVGTTQGKIEGDVNGGAFIIALRIGTLNVVWKKQIPGMNVHGLACAAYAEPATAGNPGSSSKDMLYVAGEVHGAINAELDGPDGKTTINTRGNGETDVWVAQFQAFDGKINWLKQVGTEQQDRLAKNTNNPVSDANVGEDNIGDTGSGKGALVLDRSGHALIYGTTQGSLCRAKEPSNRFRDIFVLRFHRDDGTFHSALPSDTSGSSPEDGSIHNDPGRENPEGTVKDPDASSHVRHPPSNNAGQSRSVNYTAVVLGFLLPVVLTIVIILVTRKHRPDASA